MLEHGWKYILFNAAVLFTTGALAFVIPYTLLWKLDSYAMEQGRTTAQDVTVQLLSHIEATLNEATDALSRVAAVKNSGCDPAKVQTLSTLITTSTALRHVAVVGQDGRTLCHSSAAANSSFAPASLFRPTRLKNIELGFSAEGETSQLRLFDGPNTLYALSFLGALKDLAVPKAWRTSAQGEVLFDNDKPAFGFPESALVINPKSPDRYTVEFASLRYPFKIRLSVENDVLTMPFAPIAILIKLGVGLLSLVLFALVVQSLRRVPGVEDALVRGIRNREFVPYFQPVLDIQTALPVGCEVLIRWRKPDGTMISPGAFIQKAEETGLAVEMTRQLMESARDELSAHYAVRPHIKMAFNLFAYHFSDLTIVDDVRELFQTGGIRYTQLVFEVTERYPLPNLNKALAAIAGLQQLGCRVSLDDAGTGHGGLAYLQKLGMNQVKIDKLFVDTITPGVTSSPIVDSLIQLSKRMDMEVVAEGVETVTQLDYLRRHGVTAAQGYLFAQPMPAEDYRQFLDKIMPVESSGTVAFLDVA